MLNIISSSMFSLVMLSLSVSGLNMTTHSICLYEDEGYSHYSYTCNAPVRSTSMQIKLMSVLFSPLFVNTNFNPY